MSRSQLIIFFNISSAWWSFNGIGERTLHGDRWYVSKCIPFTITSLIMSITCQGGWVRIVHRISKAILTIPQGVDLDTSGYQSNLTFSRRYLDPNRVTYEVNISRFASRMRRLIVKPSITRASRITPLIQKKVKVLRRGCKIWPESST